jgi:hypothetical protein
MASLEGAEPCEVYFNLSGAEAAGFDEADEWVYTTTGSQQRPFNSRSSDDATEHTASAALEMCEVTLIELKTATGATRVDDPSTRTSTFTVENSDVLVVIEIDPGINQIQMSAESMANVHTARTTGSTRTRGPKTSVSLTAVERYPVVVELTWNSAREMYAAASGDVEDMAAMVRSWPRRGRVEEPVGVERIDWLDQLRGLDLYTCGTDSRGVDDSMSSSGGGEDSSGDAGSSGDACSSSGDAGSSGDEDHSSGDEDHSRGDEDGINM